MVLQLVSFEVANLLIPFVHTGYGSMVPRWKNQDSHHAKMVHVPPSRKSEAMGFCEKNTSP
jgi:hypothetical protein